MKKRKITLAAGVFAISIVLLYLSEPSKWFANFAYYSLSPKCHYKLEVWISFYSKDYGFVKLYDAKSGRLLQESDVVYLTSNGEEFWPMKEGPSTLGVGMYISLPLSVEPDIPIGDCAKKSGHEPSRPSQ